LRCLTGSSTVAECPLRAEHTAVVQASGVGGEGQ
jgi:hypothetical protein